MRDSPAHLSNYPSALIRYSKTQSKNTNCGDTLLVGEREFEVVTARSQFKYAGGKRFVMTRKILEVKEITRLVTLSFLSAC